MSEVKNAAFTEDQSSELRSLVFGMMREYWAQDAVKEIARESAEMTARAKIEGDIGTRVAALATDEIGLRKMVEQLFRDSGHVVKTRSSELFDGIVAGFMRDEAGGIPDAIRQHVREHLPELVQRAVCEIMTAMLIDAIKVGSGDIAGATRQMIGHAFMTARMNPGF